MAWTTPKTWTSTTLTSSDMNTHVRDNLNAAIPVSSTITTTGTQTALSIPAGRGDLVIFCNNATTLTLQGITAAQNGQTLTLVSIGAGNVEINNQHASASAANRIINQVTGTITLVAGCGRTTMVYDSTNSRWRVLQHEQGSWLTPTFSAGNFTGNGTMTWTVAAGDVTTYSYMLDGRIMTVAWYLVTTTVGGTPTAILQIAIPNGLTSAKRVLNTFVYNDNAAGNLAGWAEVTVSGTVIELRKLTAAAWSAATDATLVAGEITFEVA